MPHPGPPSNRLLAVLVLVGLVALAGCLGGGTDGVVEATGERLDDLNPLTGTNTTAEETAAAGPGELTAADVDPPLGAEVRDVDSGVQLVFEDEELPFNESIEIPEGASLVDLRATAADNATALYPSLTHASTGAMRCTTPTARGWEEPPTHQSSCAGVTVLDPLPVEWTANVTAGLLDPAPHPSARAESLTVHIYDVALDGLVGRIDPANLSVPHHGVADSVDRTVESHDGVQLHVEILKPEDGHETYPTLLASTPYRTTDEARGEGRYLSFARDMVTRGYAVAIADVRGTGQSGGCANVWGEAGQRDQAHLVEWITDQAFSDGTVGMFGKSYGGIAAAAAAVQAPEGLEAVVPVAANYDAYRDWHHGGAPNGENLVTPVAYQGIATATTPRPASPLETLQDAAEGACDPTLAARANDPRWLYTDFHETRNFSQRGEDVEAAVLMQHGFVDGNVKPSVLNDWFDRLEVPKLGLMGHWAHTYAVRADQATLRLAWFDQFVKGQEIGLRNVSATAIESNHGYRAGATWPPAEAEPELLWPDLEEGRLSVEPAEGSAALVVGPTTTSALATDRPAEAPDRLAFTGQTHRSLGIAGQPHLPLDVTVQGIANALVEARLYEETEEDLRLVTYGQVNLAHRDNHSTYEPFTPGERDQVRLPLQPTDYAVEAGDELRLELEASHLPSRAPSHPGRLVLHGGEDGTRLELPAVDAGAYQPVPLTVDPSPRR